MVVLGVSMVSGKFMLDSSKGWFGEFGSKVTSFSGKDLIWVFLTLHVGGQKRHVRRLITNL